MATTTFGGDPVSLVGELPQVLERDPELLAGDADPPTDLGRRGGVKLGHRTSVLFPGEIHQFSDALSVKHLGAKASKRDAANAWPAPPEEPLRSALLRVTAGQPASQASANRLVRVRDRRIPRPKDARHP